MPGFKPITVYSLVLNPITVYIGFLFNCVTVGQASDSLTAVRKALIGGLVPDAAGSTVAQLEVFFRSDYL